MHSDLFFNFLQMTQDSSSAEGAEILSAIAQSKPSFLMDTGLKADDIWTRADFFRECFSFMNEEDQKIIQKSLFFTAGITCDLDAIDNRYEYVENLENTINSFRDSDEDFGENLVAIGPCGIDHDWDSVEFEGRAHDYIDNRTIQDEKDLFALQLTLGKKLNMPVIVHSRKGFKDTVDVIKAVKWNKGVIHGYSYSKSELDFFLDLGWYISFNGAVTYAGKKNALDMAETVAYVPKDRILVETDSPYYAPVPLKNTQNSPVNINYIYDYIASKRGISSAKLNAAVDENSKKLFL